MYRLQCFGGAVVKAPDGGEVHFRSRKHLALLLYLAVHPRRALGRDELAGLLWDSEEPLARHSLSQALYDIRRRLDSVQLQARRGMLSLPEGAIEYEGAELEEAVRSGELSRVPELYRGDFAPNLERLSDRFDRWLESERTRFRTVAQMALRRYAEECDLQGRWGEMCLTGLRLVRLDPLDEAAHRALMRALWLHGDQQSALRHYAQVEEFLVRELPDGISQQTRELVQRIRSSRPPARNRTEADSAEPPLVGREAEFERLRVAMESLRQGQGGLAIVRGEAGIGKTRLLQELIRLAPVEGIVRLCSRCYSAERDVAYGPVIDGIKSLAERSAQSAEADGNRYYQLGHLFPELFESAAEQEYHGVDPAVRRRRLYEEVADLLRRGCAEGPILWIIEDIQWIDSSSASLLHYVARRLRESPLLLIASLRTNDEVEDAARRLVEGDGTPVLPTFVDLSPLSTSAVRELIRHAGTPSGNGRASQLAEKYSGGNPFYALEILRAAESMEETEEPGLPTSCLSERLKRLLEGRVRVFDADELRILEAVSVLGRHASVDTVASLLEAQHSTVAVAAEGLVHKDIIQVSNRFLRFTHDLMKEFVYSSIGVLRKAALHLTVGEKLAQTGKVNAATLATHFHAAGDRGRTYEFAYLAATEARQRCAYSEAIGLASLAESAASSNAESRKALHLRALSELAQGQYEAAKTHLEKALTLLSVEPPGLHVAMHLALLRSCIETLDWRRALQVIAVVRHLLSTMPDDEAKIEQYIELLAYVVKLGLRSGHTHLAGQAVRELGIMVDRASEQKILTEDAKFEALTSQALYATFSGSTQQAYTLLSKAPVLPQSAVRRIRWHLNQSLVALRLAKWDEAEALARDGISLAQDQNDFLYAADLMNNLACIYYEQGSWEKAQIQCDGAFALYENLVAVEHAQLFCILNLGNIYFYQRRLGPATSFFEKALDLAVRGDDRVVRAELHASLGLIALQRGQYDKVSHHWAALQQQRARGRASAAQDWTKIEWFALFMNGYILRREHRAGGLVNLVQKIKGRDVLEAAKVNCLSVAFSQIDERKIVPVATSSLRRDLLDNRLLWFAKLVDRWTTSAIEHYRNGSEVPSFSFSDEI